MLVPFNINEYVHVRLTQRGLDILRKKHDELDQMLRAVGLKGLDPWTPPAVDEAGYAHFQAWSLMRDFGEHIGVFEPNAFDLNILVEIKPEKPKNAAWPLRFLRFILRV